MDSKSDHANQKKISYTSFTAPGGRAIIAQTLLRDAPLRAFGCEEIALAFGQTCIFVSPVGGKFNDQPLAPRSIWFRLLSLTTGFVFVTWLRLKYSEETCADETTKVYSHQERLETKKYINNIPFIKLISPGEHDLANRDLWLGPLLE